MNTDLHITCQTRHKKETEGEGLYRMEVVNSALEVAHQAAHVSYSGVGGGVLRDQHQRLTMVLQSLVVLPTETPEYDYTCKAGDGEKTLCLFRYKAVERIGRG